jgi:hypothetical protein
MKVRRSSLGLLVFAGTAARRVRLPLGGSGVRRADQPEPFGRRPRTTHRARRPRGRCPQPHRQDDSDRHDLPQHVGGTLFGDDRLVGARRERGKGPESLRPPQGLHGVAVAQGEHPRRLRPGRRGCGTRRRGPGVRHGPVHEVGRRPRPRRPRPTTTTTTNGVHDHDDDHPPPAPTVTETSVLTASSSRHPSRPSAPAVEREPSLRTLGFELRPSDGSTGRTVCHPRRRSNLRRVIDTRAGHRSFRTSPNGPSGPAGRPSGAEPICHNGSVPTQRSAFSIAVTGSGSDAAARTAGRSAR